MISYSCGSSAGRTSGSTGRVTSSSTSGSTGRTGGSSSLNGALGSLISGAMSVASTAINTANGGRTGSTTSSTSYVSTGGTNRNTGSSTGGTSSGGISYSCGSSSYGGSSSSVSGNSSTTKTTQTLSSLTQIGSNRTTTRVTSNLTTSAEAQIHNGNLYVGNKQVYIKEENGKKYIVDSNGNYVYGENGNRRAVNTDKLKSTTISNITYNPSQNGKNTTSGQTSTKNPNPVVKTTTTTKTPTNTLDGKLKISGDKLYVGDERVYVKKESDGKYYMVDSNGNYVYNDNGNKRAINVSNIKDMGNVIYSNNNNNQNTSNGNSSKMKNGRVTDSKIEPVNGEYYIDGKKVTISNNDKNKDGNYYLIDENGNYIRNSNGQLRVLNPSNMKEEMDNYAKYGYTYGNAQPFFDQMSAAGHSENEINDLKKNISKIEGTQITLANGTKIDTKGMSNSQIYNAVLTGGLVVNNNYDAGSYDYNYMVDRNISYDLNNIKKDYIVTSGASSGYWTNKPTYGLESGGGDHKPSDHMLSQKEYDLLCYVCMHEGLNTPEQVSATASTILNGWEGTNQTFSQYVSTACAKWSKDQSGNYDNFGQQRYNIANGNYDARSADFEMSNGNDLDKATGTTYQVVNTILDGNRTTNATQWSSYDGVYNKFTHGKNM